MTLRAELHEVFDELAPPSPRLVAKAESYVENNARRRPDLAHVRLWIGPMRGTFGFVAAGLLIALLAGIFLAGRYWRETHSSPQTVNQPALKTLEDRPVQFPTLAPGAACPTSPIVLYPRGGLAMGDGPVYFINRNPGGDTSWGSWQQLRFVYWANGPGVVLIRASDLGSNKAVAFAQDPLGPSKIGVAGRVLGTDQVADKRVQIRSEAYYRDPGASPSRPPSLYPLETVMVGVPSGASGCVGLQFDGPNFTENIVISWSHLGL